MRLYHNPISTCSQKVRLVLAEKELTYEDALIDLQKGEQFAPEYRKLNPNSVVPTLEDNGNIMIESTLINEYLEDAYPEIALTPADPTARYAMRYLCKRMDDALHGACGIVTYAIGARPTMLQRPKEEVDALINQIPDEARRETRRTVIELGVKAPAFNQAMVIHREIFDIANERLGKGEWLVGDQLGLADCTLLPYVLRLDHLCLTSEITTRPHLARWYDTIQARPSFDTAVTHWLPDATVAAFRQAGEAVADELKS